MIPTARQLWEILVPTEREGKPVRTKSHKEWDRRVRKISGGLTVLKPAKGQWINEKEEDRLYSEKVIPVRIMCNWGETERIADITAGFYKQKAIMYYKVSDMCFIKRYD